MPVIYVKFENVPEIVIDIQDSELGIQYYDLVKSQANKEPPLCRDKLNYTVDRLRELTQQANQLCNTDWHFDNFDLETTVQLHKLVEQMVGQHTLGFHGIDEKYDDLLHELHFCLHEVQTMQELQTRYQVPFRSQWITVEWFNDAGFPLPENFVFSTQVKTGSIRLQNPYVGHPPHKIFLDKDHSTIWQTCRFHDLVRPGICIVLNDINIDFVHTKTYEQWFRTHAADFVAHHGMQKILHYSGHPIIGEVRNKSELQKLAHIAQLKFEYLAF